MASLDKMEGEAVEAGMLVLLVALIYFAWLAYKGVNGIKMPDFGKLIAEALAALQAKMNDAMNWAQNHMPNSDPEAPWSGPLAIGPGTVATGTDVGTYGQTDLSDLPGASTYGPYAGVNNG